MPLPTFWSQKAGKEQSGSLGHRQLDFPSQQDYIQNGSRSTLEENQGSVEKWWILLSAIE